MDEERQARQANTNVDDGEVKRRPTTSGKVHYVGRQQPKSSWQPALSLFKRSNVRLPTEHLRLRRWLRRCQQRSARGKGLSWVENE